MKTCMSCEGDGHYLISCSRCSGTGENSIGGVCIYCLGKATRRIQCPNCEGEGKHEPEFCDKCGHEMFVVISKYGSKHSVCSECETMASERMEDGKGSREKGGGHGFIHGHDLHDV